MYEDQSIPDPLPELWPCCRACDVPLEFTELDAGICDYCCWKDSLEMLAALRSNPEVPF